MPNTAEQWELEALRARARATAWRSFADALLVRTNVYARPVPGATDAELRKAMLDGLARYGLAIEWTEPEL